MSLPALIAAFSSWGF